MASERPDRIGTNVMWLRLDVGTTTWIEPFNKGGTWFLSCPVHKKSLAEVTDTYLVRELTESSY